MAATVATYVYNGVAPGAAAAATNVRFRLIDNNTQDANNPNIIPAAGNNYSFWKTMVLYCVAVNGMVNITNVKLYSDGSIDWGTAVVLVGDQVTDTYQQAVVDPGNADSGLYVLDGGGGHGQISSVTDIENYVVGSPFSVAAAAGWATPGAGEPITGYVVLQLRIPSTATGGAQAAETLTWQYDET